MNYELAKQLKKEIKIGTLYGCEMYIKVPEKIIGRHEWANVLQNYIKAEKKRAVYDFKFKEEWKWKGVVGTEYVEDHAGLVALLYVLIWIGISALPLVLILWIIH
jgi:hypothetical protein